TRLVNGRHDHAERTVIDALHRGLGNNGRRLLRSLDRRFHRRGGGGFHHGGALRLLVCTRGGLRFGGLLLAALLFLGFALALCFRFALMRLFLAAAIRLQALVFLVIALLLRFLQLAHGVLALNVSAGFFGDDAALDVGALRADFDVHRLGASGAAGA